MIWVCGSERFFGSIDHFLSTRVIHNSGFSLSSHVFSKYINISPAASEKLPVDNNLVAAWKEIQGKAQEIERAQLATLESKINFLEQQNKRLTDENSKLRQPPIAVYVNNNNSKRIFLKVFESF